MTRVRTKSRKSEPETRSISSASTQCAEVGWYSKRVPGSQLHLHCAKRASRRSRSSQSSGANGAAREARGVQHHLLDRDVVLAVRAELGHDIGDRPRHVDARLRPSSIQIADATTGFVEEKIT